MAKDLKHVYMKFMNVPDYEKIAVSSFKGVHSHHKNHLSAAMMRIRIFYPVLLHQDLDQSFSEEQQKAIKLAQDLLIKKHGESAKKTLEIENEMRRTQVLLLFSKTHNLQEAYGDSKMAKPVGGAEKVGVEELIKREGVEFLDGNVKPGIQSEILMAALNGYQLKYEGEAEAKEEGDSDTESEEME